jgi:N6-adenosine-specific RNA methylase IME4
VTAPDAHPVADIFPMMSDAEIADLADDIKVNGQRNAIWLHRDGRIIDGRNRWRACESAGVEPATRVYSGAEDSLVAFVVSLNLKRRHLNESQRAMVADRIATLRDGQRKAGSPIGEPAVTQQEAAELLNVGKRSVERAREVRESGAPELTAAVERGEVAVSTAAVIAREPVEVQREVLARVDPREIVRAAKEIQVRQRDERLREKAAKVAEIASTQTQPLDSIGPFPVLYVDPPWRYEFADATRAIENQYPTMTLDDIKALDVPAADDAVMFMWVTSPKLADGLDVLTAWGFEYRTCMVWVKDKIGMGYYARQQHELLLIAKRGNPRAPDPEDRPSSVLTAARGEHSAKPDEMYELIERMYPLAEKCEMFQRRSRNGWAGWGNQAEAAS